MPCFDERGSTAYNLSIENQEKLDKYARMLCSTLRTLPEHQILKLTPETQRWWVEHQKFDRAREERSLKRRGIR